MRSESRRPGTRRPPVKSSPHVLAPPVPAAGANAGPELDLARLLARLEDTAWLTAQAISVGTPRAKRPRDAAATAAAPVTARRKGRAPASSRGASDCLVGERTGNAGKAEAHADAMLEPGARALLDALPVPVLWLDPHGDVRHCNATALARLGSPLLGVRWRDFVATRLATLVPVPTVLSNAFRNGQLVLLPDAGQGAVAASAAMTARPGASDAERVREQQLVRLGRVSAGLAHQLRTPIAATQLYLDLAAHSGDRSYLDKAQSSLDALTHHCESVLTLARGELRCERGVTLTALLALVQRQALALRGTLAVEQPAAATGLDCNPHLLAGAVLNLVDNAFRASPTGTARLEVRLEGESVRLTVIDDGDGMPEALRLRLGQPLPSSRPEGSGFGLAMANMIVEAHGGALSIESAPAAGTRVHVSLPCTRASDGPQQHERQEQRTMGSMHP